MEILPARGRRRRDGKRSAAGTPFPWEQAPAEPDGPVEDDATSVPVDDPSGGETGYADEEQYPDTRYPDAQDAYAQDADAQYGGESAYGDSSAGDGAHVGDGQYGEAQYGDSQYGEAQYGEAQYGDTQYGDAQYGEGQYGEGQYGEDVDAPSASPGWSGDELPGQQWSGQDQGDDQADDQDWAADENWAEGQEWAEDEGDDLDDGYYADSGAQTADASGAAATSRRRARQGTEPVARRRPSAGRNLPAAVGVGVALASLVVASLFIRKEAFVAVVAVAVGLAVWELTQAFAERRIHVPLVPLLVGSLGMVVSGFAAGEEAMLVAFALTALAVLLWRVIDDMDGAVRDVAAGIFTAAYVPFLAGFAMLMLAADDGPRRIVVFVLVTVASDIGGYAVGVVAGRHPMAPSVSPKKSWEGLAGSAAFCLVAGIASVTILLDGSWWAGALVGLATVVTATVGDLSESLLKRDLGIKDMGSLLPGHGGMMDRLDSLLPTAPAAYLLLAVLVPVAS